MPTRTDCLELIGQTRSASSDPDSAYILRARLKRSILAVGQYVASVLNLPMPTLPEDVLDLEASDPAAAALLRRCTTVLGQARTLCQPSESLDDRWRTGWKTLELELIRLESDIRSLTILSAEA